MNPTADSERARQHTLDRYHALDTLPSGVGAGLTNDWVPNGAACTYFTSGSPASVKNKIFFLTQ